MNAQHISTFLSRKGQIVTVSWVRPMKTLKTVAGTVTKSVTTQARAGVNYDNMRDVIAKRESGELPAENAGLPWGRWASIGGVSLFPHVIAHTPKGKTNEVHYLRFATLPSGNPAKVVYMRDGQPITKEQARAITLASEWNEGEKDVFNVCAEHITSIR
jgi:hypothetical protein